MGSTIKAIEIKGKFCFEIIPATGGIAKKKSKDKSYIFQVNNDSDRDKWVDSLRRAALFRPAMSLEIDSDGNINNNTGSGLHDNPMHENSTNSTNNSTSKDEDDEDGNINSFRTMSSSSFRMTNMIPTEREGYLMKKSPALMKGWQKRYFITNTTTGDIDYYKSVSTKYMFMMYVYIRYMYEFNYFCYFIIHIVYIMI